MVIVAALPGVREDAVKLAVDGAALVIAGERAFPEEMRRARIHRLELPQGCFERRVPLPSGRYDKIQAKTVNGCLIHWRRTCRGSPRS